MEEFYTLTFSVFLLLNVWIFKPVTSYGNSAKLQHELDQGLHTMKDIKVILNSCSHA
jgi:hypothetical protein